jgi:hypothetical protein
MASGIVCPMRAMARVALLAVLAAGATACSADDAPAPDRPATTAPPTTAAVGIDPPQQTCRSVQHVMDSATDQFGLPESLAFSRRMSALVPSADPQIVGPVVAYAQAGAAFALNHGFRADEAGTVDDAFVEVRDACARFGVRLR